MCYEIILSHSNKQVILALSMREDGILFLKVIRLMMVNHMHLLGIANCKMV